LRRTRVAASRPVTSGYRSVEWIELTGFARLERRALGGWAADVFFRAALAPGSR
jgi:hypothetical protein